MAEAFIVRRGGGGGSGGTLVVTSSGAGTVTVSNSALNKSYSKSVTAGGSVTFKGLKTGEWTVTLSNGTQTTTRSVTINADYSVPVAYFSATISVTYPANSTCVVTNPGGQTVASDTNTGTSTKTWTATVNATGTYTVTATATDGSGKTKSTTVSITADGQSESITLTYELVLFDNGTYAAETGGWNKITNNKLEVSISSTTMEGKKAWVHTKNSVDLSEYTTLHFILDSTSSTRDQGRKVGVSDTANGELNAQVAIKNSSTIGEHTVDISSISISIKKSQYIQLYCDAWPNENGAYAGTTMTISKIWLT